MTAAAQSDQKQKSSGSSSSSSKSGGSNSTGNRSNNKNRSGGGNRNSNNKGSGNNRGSNNSRGNNNRGNNNRPGGGGGGGGRSSKSRGGGGGQGGYRNNVNRSSNAKPNNSNSQTEQQPVEVVEEPKGPPSQVVVGDHITVRDLARLIERSPIDLIKVLMQYGVMAPITHNIDHDTAVILGDELGVKVVRERTAEPEPVVVIDESGEKIVISEPAEETEEVAVTGRGQIQQILGSEKEEKLSIRPAVVAVLGHVDHGKTTLLDQIRKTDVVSGEAGGITQRTGAYQVEVQGQKITFLDTPGHEAFTGMRARGAQVTDIVVLVVAADDGLMPQTREAISHAQAAGVQMIVAMNKIDRPNANTMKVLEELASAGLQPEEWGGETIVVPVSALLGTGIDDLLENILVVAELEEYKANPNGTFAGTVIEGLLDRHRGATTTLLVQNGTLKVGDSLVVGNTWGRVKAMFDHDGNPLKEAGPSCPVVMLGLQDVPTAGDVVERCKNDREARRKAEDRALDAKANADQPMTQQRMSFLNLVVRADMQGTLEPVVKSLGELGNEEVEIKILQSAIGNISESDIMLAEASDAVVIGFSVQVDKAAQTRAEASGIEIRRYDIIYKMLEDVQDAVTGMLEPIYEDRTIGKAKVLQLFKLRRGVIIGCNVAEGIIKRGAKARVWRETDEIMSNTSVDTLRRFTEDVPEVRTGFECGLRLADHSTALKEGDIIEVYEKFRIR